MLPDLTPEERSRSPDVMGGEGVGEASKLQEKFLEIRRLPNYFESRKSFPSLNNLKAYKTWLEENSWESLAFPEHINLIIGMGNYLLQNSSNFDNKYIYEIEKVVFTMVNKLSDFPEDWPNYFGDLLDENLEGNVMSMASSLVMKIKSVFLSGKLDVSAPIDVIITDMRKLGKFLRNFSDLIEPDENEN